MEFQDMQLLQQENQIEQSVGRYLFQKVPHVSIPCYN